MLLCRGKIKFMTFSQILFFFAFRIASDIKKVHQLCDIPYYCIKSQSLFDKKNTLKKNMYEIT